LRSVHAISSNPIVRKLTTARTNGIITPFPVTSCRGSRTGDGEAENRLLNGTDYTRCTITLNGFYRTMLCIPCTMVSQDVCLFVCLFVCHTPVFCRKRPNLRIIKLFHRRVATLFNFFHIKQYGNIPTSTSPPHNGGVEYKGYGKKIRDFRPKFRFISEIIQDRAMVTVKCE